MPVKLIYDAQKRELSETDPLSLSGFISWNRLTQLLQEHEAFKGEKISHLVIGDRGIGIRYT